MPRATRHLFYKLVQTPTAHPLDHFKALAEESPSCHSVLGASAFGYQHPSHPFGPSPRSSRCDLLGAHA